MSKSQREFKRQLFGYRRKAVDEHLAVVDASIADLREAVERTARSDQHELVLRATRLAVEEVMQRAHDDAQRIRTDAEAEAAQMLADAYDIVSAREAVIDLRPEAAAHPTPETPDSHQPPVSGGGMRQDAPQGPQPGADDWSAELTRALDD